MTQSRDQIFSDEQLLKPGTLLDIIFDLHFSFAALLLPFELNKFNKRTALDFLSRELQRGGYFEHDDRFFFSVSPTLGVPILEGV